MEVDDDVGEREENRRKKVGEDLAGGALGIAGEAAVEVAAVEGGEARGGVGGGGIEGWDEDEAAGDIRGRELAPEVLDGDLAGVFVAVVAGEEEDGGAGAVGDDAEGDEEVCPAAKIVGVGDGEVAGVFADGGVEGDGAVNGRWLAHADPSLLRIEELNEAVVLLGVGDVGEGVGVEGFEEALERFAQGGFEAADGDDGAGVGFEFEALDDFEIRFAGTDDVAEADLRGWRGEGDAARAAGGGGDEMVGGEGLDHADEMVL